MAGYGNIVGYEDAPMPGAYYFTDKGGAKRLFSGPVAEDLKAKIDASSSLQPKLASNAGGQPGAASYFPGLEKGLSGSPPPEARLDAPPAAAPVLPPAQKPQPVQGGAPDPNGGTVPIGLGLRQDPRTGQILEYQAPVAASKGGAVERGRTVSGGFEANPEYEDAMMNASIDKKLALEDQNEANQIDTEQAILQAEEDRQRIQNDLIEQNQKTAQVSAGVAALEQKRAAAIQAVASHKEDPKKAESDVYNGKEGLWGLLAVIGGMGSALSGQPDRVHQLIESRIERNVAAQRVALDVKRDNANNLLQELTRQTGDQKLAEMTLKDTQRQVIANELQRKALTSKSAKDRAFYLDSSARLQQEIAQSAEEYRIRAGGNVTKSIVNVPGSAGRAGGYYAVDPRTGLQFQQGLATLDKTKREAAATAEKPKGSAQQRQQLAEIQAGRDAIKRHMALDEGGMVLNTGFAGSDESQALGSQTVTMVPILGRALEGNAPNESTMDALTDSLNSTSGAKRHQARKALLSQLDAKERAIRATLGEEPAPAPAAPSEAPQEGH